MEQIIALMPHGFPSNKSWIQHGLIRQLNGYDEQLIAEIDSLPIPQKTTTLLTRVVTFDRTTAESEKRRIIRDLTVGDRVALTLQLQKFTLGDKLSCVLNCPFCGKPMSLELSVTSLLQPVIPNAQSNYSIQVDNATLTVRPVKGADLEAITERNTQPNLEEQIVRSCIISSESPLQDELNDDFLVQVSSKLEELDPQADVNLDLSCPDCKQQFQAPFDIEKYIFQEFTQAQDQLERETHWIAFNYHWSEDSILSLPFAKRKRYAELINATLSGEII